MNYRTPSQVAIRHSIHCYAWVVVNLLLAITFAITESGYPSVHIVLALIFALLTEYYRHKHMDELKNETEPLE